MIGLHVKQETSSIDCRIGSSTRGEPLLVLGTEETPGVIHQLPIDFIAEPLTSADLVSVNLSRFLNELLLAVLAENR